MKIVKLNRRFKQFKEAGHTVALRFDHWTPEAHHAETICRSIWAHGGYNIYAEWYSYFGSATKSSNGFRPFWITFKHESDMTMVLLGMNHG
jgi:hypothetical protein